MVGIGGNALFFQELAEKYRKLYKTCMETSWTREQLAVAVDAYLALLESQKQGGAPAPEVAVRTVAAQTGRGRDEARAILNTVGWLMDRCGALVCRGFRLQCETDERTLAVLEEILARDRKVDRVLHRKPWSRGELKAAVDCYRGIVRDEQAGVPVDRAERISALAEDLARKFSAVRLRMQNISWILSERGLPVADCIPLLSGVGRKVMDAVLDVYGELEAAESGAGEAPWTEEQLRAVLVAYRELAGLEASKARFDAGDRICALAQETGRRFSQCRLRLANVAWLMQKRGRKPIACLEPAEDMPEETMAALERLLDEGVPSS